MCFTVISYDKIDKGEDKGCRHCRTYLSACFLCREIRLQQILRTRFQVLSLDCCSGKSIRFSSTTTSSRSTKSLNQCPRVTSKADGMCDFNCQDSKCIISHPDNNDHSQNRMIAGFDVWDLVSGPNVSMSTNQTSSGTISHEGYLRTRLG